MNRHQRRAERAGRDPQDLASKKEFAQHLGVSERTVDRMIAAGQIPAYRVGRLVRLDLNDVDRVVTPIPNGAA